MEIESLRLDFLTLIITKAQNNIRAYQRRKEEKKKKKKPKEPRPSRATQAACGPGHRMQPRQHAAQATRCPGRARPGLRGRVLLGPRM